MQLKTILKAIDKEPEYPAEMPDELWLKMKKDRAFATEVLRKTVTLTKLGIADRVKKLGHAFAIEKEEGLLSRREKKELNREKKIVVAFPVRES